MQEALLALAHEGTAEAVQVLEKGRYLVTVSRNEQEAYLMMKREALLPRIAGGGGVSRRCGLRWAPPHPAFLCSACSSDSWLRWGTDESPKESALPPSAFTRRVDGGSPLILRRSRRCR